MEDQADLHELLDGADEEMDFEPEDEAATPAASAQRRKALRPASTAAKPARCAAARLAAHPRSNRRRLLRRSCQPDCRAAGSAGQGTRR